MNNCNDRNKYVKLYEDFIEEVHFLVGPLKKICQQHADDNIKYYEYTQTISPKTKIKYMEKNCLLSDMDPEVQYEYFHKLFKQYTTDNKIFMFVTFEFQKNGNIHTHAITRHNTGYEIKLRKMQKYFKRQLGRNSLSEIKSIQSWIGYMVKEIKQTDMKPKIYNLHIVDNEKHKEKSILYYFNDITNRQIKDISKRGQSVTKVSCKLQSPLVPQTIPPGRGMGPTLPAKLG